MPAQQPDDDLVSSIKSRASEQGVTIADVTHAGVVVINGIKVEAWRIAALAVMCLHRVPQQSPVNKSRRS